MQSKENERQSRDVGSTSVSDAAAQTADKQIGLAPGTSELDPVLGVWSSWMEAGTNVARQLNQGITVDPAGLSGEALKQITERLRQDPLVRSVDELLNKNPFHKVIPIDWAEIARALRIVWLRSLANPAKSLPVLTELGFAMWRSSMEIWLDAGKRLLAGSEGEDPAAKREEDKRFAAPEWQTNPFFRALKQSYLIASEWLLKQADADDMDESERQRLTFHLRQFVDAMSPTLFIASNPVVLRRAIETGGASLADGVRNLMGDMKEGRLSMVDATAFAPGRNLALSPGKVVYRNKLIELIQYVPTTDTVYERPLLIFPPWINKYYILDLQPKNSMVKWLTEQGFTVFIVSWKNPDESMEDTTIEDYLELGPLAASDVVRDITGSETINVMGYCIGGTLLALSLAWLAARQDARFNAATFIVSLQDFSRVGDTAVFLGEPTVDFIEQQMMERGYLDSREMANMFNLLRSNDLIWSNVVNNYLLGQKPPAFDLLYWNSDGTRMARAAHSWYLRNTYVENNLIVPEKIELKGEAIDLGRIKQDIYAVGAEKDHIVPWEAAWRVTQLVGGKVRYVLASSGHIAGIINPPGGKGTFWAADATKEIKTPQDWRRAATRRDGSWWTDWKAWLADHSGKRVKPPPMGNDKHKPLQDAPGSYVLMV